MSEAASNGLWPGAEPQQCPRCGYGGFAVLLAAGDRLYGTTSRRFHLVECARCGLMRLDPRPQGEELAQFYPETYWWTPESSAAGRLEDLYRRIVLSDHVRFVRAGLEDRTPVLDVGCGGGSFLSALARRGVAAFGLDNSPRAAGVAWLHHAVPVACGSLDSAPFAPETFGGITMFHLLEHLADPQRCLRAAHRLLRGDGRLYVQVPNASCWQFLLLGDRWSGLDAPRHLIHFRAEDLEGLLVQCGFRPLRKKFFSLRDNPAGLATSLAPQLEPMSRRVRGAPESAAVRLLKDFAYLAVVMASLPFTALEAAAGAGSTILIEAAKP
jgi:SAM-dependent methyltransferase